MFGVIGGSVLILLAVAIIGYTIYKLVADTPNTPLDWSFQTLYLVCGVVVGYYGYQTLYPPTLSVYGGRRR